LLRYAGRGSAGAAQLCFAGVARSADDMNHVHPAQRPKTPDFRKTLWLDQHRSSSRGFGKRAIYFFLRPLLSSRHRRLLSPETLDACKPELVLGPRGMPIETRRRWATAHLRVRDSTILVQGTGTGWDVVS